MFNIVISDTIYNRIIASNEGSPLHRLLKQQPSRLLSSADTDYLKQHPEAVLKSPSSLYILDVQPAEALSIRRSFGVICLSGDNPDIIPLIDVNDIHISNEHEKLGRGWDSVLDSVEKLPSNALLLTDRYLFAFRHPNAGDGLANIHDILNELLPQQFEGGDYHVTIVFDDRSKHSSYTFDEIATKLNRIKTQLGRNYPIMMEVLGITPDCSIYNKLHNRLIVSNYYLVEAGHKLAAFNKDQGTARQMLIPMTLFTEASLNGTSTPPLKAIEQTVATLREFSKSLSQLSDHSVYLYAVNGKRMEKCMGIRNRLIK
ncbi:hypothetical protein L6470_09830 [Prevotella communis]|uniref:hypothetical protein n=1 Tax=Prevotella communis TaxID=2913614 RepID=UPI001EDC17B6|nr:hypothetical protein [Prevotella communis]UKK58671.1 hypothetical protein L6470_09830 [Prevotella communis]